MAGCGSTRPTSFLLTIMRKSILLALAGFGLLLSAPAHTQQLPRAPAEWLAWRSNRPLPDGLLQLSRLPERPLAPATRVQSQFRLTQTLSQRYINNIWTTEYRDTHSSFTPMKSRPQLTQIDTLSGTTALPRRQRRRQYNFREQIITDTILAWTNSQRYDPTWVFSYSYTPQDSLARYTAQTRMSGTLVPNYRVSYTYDASTRRLTQILDEDYSQNMWYVSGRNEYTYDSQGRVSQVEYLPLLPNGTFSPLVRHNYTYNNQNLLQMQVVQIAEDALYENAIRVNFTYNTNRQLVNQAIEYWNTDTWAPSERYLFAYNADGNQTSRTHQGYIDDVYKDMDRLLHTYERVLSTGSARTLNASLTLVPNPACASTSTTLHYTLTTAAPVHVEIIDVIGRSVLHLPAVAQKAGAHTLLLPHLPAAAGLYGVRLTAGSQSQTVKLLVQ